MTTAAILNRQLVAAVESNNVEDVRHLLSQPNVNVNATDRYGWSVLMIASKYGHIQIMQCLVETNQVNVEAVKRDGATALLLASFNGRLPAVQYLIESGHANVEAAMTDGSTSLNVASQKGHLTVVQYLVATCGANVEASTIDGMTAMFIASQNGHLQVVQYLFETGNANVEAALTCGATAVYIASQNGHLLVVKYLVEKCSANAMKTRDGGMTALIIASQVGHLNVVQYLLGTGQADVEATEKHGGTALFMASQLGHLNVIQCLVESGKANVEAPIQDGETPLYIACQNGHLTVVQYLVKICRANVEAANENGLTPLFVASNNGHVQVVRYLIEVGEANVEATLSNGATTLMLASLAGHMPVVQCLVETGNANVLAATEDTKQTALDIAKGEGESHADIVAYLEQHTSTRASPVLLPLPIVPRDSNAPGPAAEATLTADQLQMKAAIHGRGETLAVSNSYIQSILTDKVLGRGCFGTVYKGFDHGLGHSFAIKAINTEILASGNLEFIQRTKQTFEIEQQTLSHFRHPNIVRLFAYSFPTEVRGNHYLVYEIADNGALDSFLRTDLKRLRLSLRRRIQIALDVMTAIQFLHVGNADKNVTSCFHRDIKSANIVLQQDLTARLIDCGLAKFVMDDKDGMAQTASSANLKGTPGYICPDFSSGQVKTFDCACDIYSFGVVLAELWIGNIQNYEQDSGGCFNFTDQYIRLKKGKTKRNLLIDADPSFGFAPADAMPSYMVRYVDLAKCCMGDHEDIPDGKDVMRELLAIRQACEADEDGTALMAETPSASSGQQTCERCQSFPKMTQEVICRMCWGEEQRRGEMEKIFVMLQSFGEELNVIRSDTQAKLEEVGTETRAAIAKLDEIGADVRTTSAKFNARGPEPSSRDVKFSDMVPRLFFIVPAKKASEFLHLQEYLNGKVATEYYMYFVCSHTKCLVEAPIKIRLNKEWVLAAAPALAVGLKIVQLGLSEAGVTLKMNGFDYKLTPTSVGQMLLEVLSIVADTESHNDLVCRLQDEHALSDTDVPVLKGEAIKLVVEKATEQSSWRNLMEPVFAADAAAIVWVTKDVANNPDLGYIKAHPEYQ